MPDYQDGKNTLLGRPEPGRSPKPVKEVKEVKEVKVVQESNINVDAIASAVVKALGDRMPTGTVVTGEGKEQFSSSKSLDRLADAMVEQRGSNESNFEGLGNIKETKKDKKEVDDTIERLSNLED